jgi:hypothetical protein
MIDMVENHQEHRGDDIRTNGETAGTKVRSVEIVFTSIEREVYLRT